MVDERQCSGWQVPPGLLPFDIIPERNNSFGWLGDGQTGVPTPKLELTVIPFGWQFREWLHAREFSEAHSFDYFLDGNRHCATLYKWHHSPAHQI